MENNARLIKELDIVRPGSEVLVSEHPDSLVSVERGYGSTRPEDYLESFRNYLYVAEHQDEIPALLAVTQRPREDILGGLIDSMWKITLIALELCGLGIPARDNLFFCSQQ